MVIWCQFPRLQEQEGGVVPSPQGSQEFHPREQLGKLFGRHQVFLTEWKGPVVFKLN